MVQRSRPALGTFVTASVYAIDRDTGLKAISEAFKEFDHVDDLLSIHRTDTELAEVNRLAARQPVPLSDELFDILTRVQTISRQTDGAFDPTIRPLAELWGFIWKQQRLPSEDELGKTLPLVDFHAVELDPAAHTIHFEKPGLSLDSGGFGKGYAVDLAIERLLEIGITSAMVRAGGDLRVIGTPPGQSTWTVQLEDPRKAGERITVPLRAAALSTSGNYENYLEVGGRRYSHILDPRTGLPVQGVAACTVIADTCLESDAWATALFVIGPKVGIERFGRRFPSRFVTVETNSNMILDVIHSGTFPSSPN